MCYFEPLTRKSCVYFLFCFYKVRGKKIDQETEGLILGFLRQKFSERLIINELKKLKISVSNSVIFRI